MAKQLTAAYFEQKIQRTLTRWEEERPDVVWLAALASLARRIEPELLRALRYEVGSKLTGPARPTVGSEAALWLSSFVESRGSDSITLLPSYLPRLRQKLQAHRDLLNHARKVIVAAHAKSAPVIQWEEELIYLGVCQAAMLAAPPEQRLDNKQRLRENEQRIERLIRQGVATIAPGDRRGLEQWMLAMTGRLPDYPPLTALAGRLRLYVIARGAASAGQANPAGPVDFSRVPRRIIRLRHVGQTFQIGVRLADAHYRLSVPDVQPLSVDVAFGDESAPWQPMTIPATGAVELAALRSPLRVQTLDGNTYQIPFKEPVDVFLSYSSPDSEIAERVAEALRAAGISVWVAHQQGIPIGTPTFDQAIQDVLTSCRRGLLLLSEHSARSRWVTREWNYLLTQGKPLYVARIADLPQADVPLRLSSNLYTDLAHNYEQGMAALIKALKSNQALDLSQPGTTLSLRISGYFPHWQLRLPITGRDEELAQVEKLLDESRPIMITGGGGVGKTRLAAELATRATNLDGVVWFRLAHTTTLAEAGADLDQLTMLVREHLRLDPAAPADWVWRALNDSQTLLILNDADDCQHPQPFIDRLNKLYLRKGAAVLITSRTTWPQLRDSWFHRLDVPAPEAAEQILRAMIAEHSGRSISSFTSEEIKALVKAAYYHPRLMELASGWLEVLPVAAVTQKLREIWTQRSQGDRDIDSVLHELVGNAVESLRHQPYGETAVDALRRLVVCRGGFTPEAADALLPVRSANSISLNMLVQQNLLRFDRERHRYETDPLVRAVVAPDSGSYSLHYTYYYALAQQLDAVQDYVKLAAETANLEAAFEWALAAKEVTKAYWLTSAAANMLRQQGRSEQVLEWLQRIEQALPADADYALRGELYNSLGAAYAELSRTENRVDNMRRAIVAFETALHYSTESAVPLAFATTQHNLGIAYRALSQMADRALNLENAIAAYHAALTVYTREAHPIEWAMTQNNLGDAYRDRLRGDRALNLEEAIATYHAALSFYTPEVFPLAHATTQNNLGNAYWDLSQVEDREDHLRRAITAYEAALRHYAETAAPLDFAATQERLGASYTDLAQMEDPAGNLLRAISAFEAALRYYTEPASPIHFARTQRALGNAYRSLAQVEDPARNLHRAISAYGAALRHYSETAAAPEFIATQTALGNAYRGLLSVNEIDAPANAEAAQAAYQHARRAAVACDDAVRYATATNEWGVMAEILGNRAAAVKLWEEAEAHLRRMGYAAEADRQRAWINEAQAKLGSDIPPEGRAIDDVS